MRINEGMENNNQGQYGDERARVGVALTANAALHTGYGSGQSDTKHDKDETEWSAHEYVEVKEERSMMQPDGTNAVHEVTCIHVEPGKFMYDDLEDFYEIEFPCEALRRVGLDVISLDARYITDLVVEAEKGEFTADEYFIGKYRQIFYPGKRTEQVGPDRDENGLPWNLGKVHNLQGSFEPDDDYDNDVTLYFPCRSLFASGHNAMSYDADYILELVEADYRKRGDNRAEAIASLRKLFF